MFIPTHGSEFFPSRIRIEKFRYFNPKNWFLNFFLNMMVVSSQIRIPGSKRHRFPHPEHWISIYLAWERRRISRCATGAEWWSAAARSQSEHRRWLREATRHPPSWNRRAGQAGKRVAWAGGTGRRWEGALNCDGVQRGRVLEEKCCAGPCCTESIVEKGRRLIGMKKVQANKKLIKSCARWSVEKNRVSKLSTVRFKSVSWIRIRWILYEKAS